MEKLTIALPITAAILHGIAYVLYNIQTKLGKSSPNAASWSIWAFLAILNGLSYRALSHGTIPALQFLTGSVAAVCTFAYALVIGKLAWPTRKEWRIFAIALLGALVWWKFRNAAAGNTIVAIAFVVSFIPTFKGVLRDPFKETSLPWALWTIAFLLTIIAVALRDGSPIRFLMPVTLLVTHVSIVVLTRPARKARFQQQYAHLFT